MSGAAYLSFTDGIGAAQLDNGLTAVAGGYGSHFVNWTSESTPIGPAKYALGTGARAMFTFRTDYTAEFELQEIPNANTAILDRLIAWLLGGGQCSVTCGDSTAAVYASCGLAEGNTPKKKLFSKQDMTWSLTLKLVNLAGSPVPMTAIYP
jgi:hypothetical protein